MYDAISVIFMMASLRMGRGFAVFRTSAAYWQKNTSERRDSKLLANAFMPLWA